MKLSTSMLYPCFVFSTVSENGDKLLPCYDEASLCNKSQQIANRSLYLDDLSTPASSKNLGQDTLRHPYTFPYLPAVRSSNNRLPRIHFFAVQHTQATLVAGFVSRTEAVSSWYGMHFYFGIVFHVFFRFGPCVTGPFTFLHSFNYIRKQTIPSHGKTHDHATCTVPTWQATYGNTGNGSRFCASLILVIVKNLE